MSDEIEAVGAFATAGLAARAIEGGSGAHSGHAATCANCGTALAGAYCSECGQRAHVHRSLLHMGEELVHGIAHFDGKIWRTLPMLFFKPGQLTRAYIEGRRTRFVSPMALFLFVVFLMFLVFSLTSHNRIADGFSDGSIGSWEPSAAVTKSFEAHAAEARQTLAATVAAGQDPILAAEAVSLWEKAAADSLGTKEKASKSGIDAEGLGDLKITTKLPGLDQTLRRMAKNPELLIYKLKNTAYKFSFLLVPISLPFMWLLFFWRRDVKMYDHAVFALYSLCFMSLLFTLVALIGGIDALPSAVVPLLIAFVPPIHMYSQLKHAYGLSRTGALVRTALLLIFSLVALCLFAAAIFALGVSE